MIPFLIYETTLKQQLNGEKQQLNGEKRRKTSDLIFHRWFFIVFHRLIVV